MTSVRQRPSADVRPSSGRGPRETSARWSDPDFRTAQSEFIAAELTARFPQFDPETVLRATTEATDGLAAAATVTNYLPILIRRRALERLRQEPVPRKT